MSAHFLKTKRLQLRPYESQDFDQILDLLRDSQVMKFSFKGAISSKSEGQKYIQKFFIDLLKENLGLWPIFKNEGQKLVGFAGFLPQELDQKQYIELGYRLSPDYWGQGFAKEACLALCEYAKNELGIHELISFIDPRNLASIYLSKSLGFSLKKKIIQNKMEVDIYYKLLS